MVGRFCHVHVHLAGSGAFPAGDALILIHLHLEEGHPVEQRVECAQRAEPLAKRPVEQHTQHDHRQQNAEFPCKQLAQRRPDAGIGKGDVYKRQVLGYDPIRNRIGEGYLMGGEES